MTSKRAVVAQLPAGVLLAWYGDDFTGSAAVMEVMEFAGLSSILYLGIPTPAQRARFGHARGIGIAGTARSRSPGWMREHLPANFEFLKSLDAPITQYKICSTLDSSPNVGSIGAAIEVGQSVFDSPWIPMFAAAPIMRRYQAFGHFFAGASGGVFRLDRHPVMACHPVTPMDESDVNLHLSRQTKRCRGLIDLECLANAADAQARLDQLLQSDIEIVTIDSMSQSDIEVAGELIWDNAADGLFAVGSQGIAYALIAHWQSKGLIPCNPAPAGAGELDTIMVVSGSVSVTTRDQIDWSLANGFVGVPLEAATVALGGTDAEDAIMRAVAGALAAIETTRSPIVYTARGPDDPAVSRFREVIATAGVSAATANQRVGIALGQIVDRTLRQSGLQRVVISGGDTSGHATSELSIFALSALAPTIPGAALFQAHSEDARYDGLQLALKGGQMGSPDYFDWIRRGGGPHHEALR